MIKYADRVAEITATTGTGTYTLAGAQQGYQSFGAGIGDAQKCYYCVTDGTSWEVGLGTYTAAGTLLSRDTILSSSNSNLAVSWAAGNKDAFVVEPALASKVVELDNVGLKVLDTDSSNTLTVKPGSNLTVDRVLTVVTGDADRTLTLTGDASIAGTNTGDQTITLTGDVTGTGTGSFATTYANSVPVAKGGTGQTALGTANKILGIVAAGGSTEWKSLAAGTGITVTESAGVFTIAASGGGGSTGGLSAVRIYTAGATWTKPTGLTRIRVTVVGGGGASAGNGSANHWTAGSGAGGGTAIKLIEAATLGATETVTVGAGGSPGAAWPHAGGTGGSSSFGAHCSASGGGGCSGATAGIDTAMALGGSGTNGDFNYDGGCGSNGILSSASGTTCISQGSFPGGSFFNYGNRKVQSWVQNGSDALGYGGGVGAFPGGGGQGRTSAGSAPTTTNNGYAGGAGVVIVEEYI